MDTAVVVVHDSLMADTKVVVVVVVDDIHYSH
jgi:hypothetical protein